MRKIAKIALLILLSAVFALSLAACDDATDPEDTVTRFTLELVSAEDDDATIDADTLPEGETVYYTVTGYTFSADDAEILSRAADYPYYYTDEYDGDRLQNDKDAYLAEKAKYENLKTLVLPAAVKISGRESRINLTYDQLYPQGKPLAKGAVIDLSDEGDANAETINVRAVSDSALLNHTEIESLVVPDSYLYIGAGAFSGLSALKEIELPFVGQKVGAVNGAKVFGYVFGTTEYTGGTSVAQSYNLSGTATYYIPTSLAKITVNSALPAYAFHSVAMAESIVYPKDAAEEIPEYAFSGCTSLKSIELGADITAIGEGAFSGCSVLDGIDFTKFNKLASIYNSAFSNCSRLGFSSKVLTMPVTITHIGESAFAGCTSIETLTVNSAINVDIKAGAFSGMTSLKVANLTKANLSVGAFSGWKEPWKDGEEDGYFTVTLNGCKVNGTAITDNTDVNKLLPFTGAFAEDMDLQKKNIVVTVSAN